LRHSLSRQTNPSRQSQFLCFEVWFRTPLPVVLWMHLAVKPDAWLVLTNQTESTRQARAFRAAKLKALSNFLDRESVDHSLDATHTAVSTTSQKGGCWPLFRGVTSAITNAIRLADGRTLSSYVGHILLIAGTLQNPLAGVMSAMAMLRPLSETPAAVYGVNLNMVPLSVSPPNSVLP
jgi:hypothetical protein